MFKKLFFSFVFVAALASFSFASFGISLKGGSVAGSDNFNDYLLNNYMTYAEQTANASHDAIPDKQSDNGFGNIGVELFFDQYITPVSAIGIKVGYTYYTQNSINNDYWQKDTSNSLGYSPFELQDYTVKAHIIPIMVYYKYDMDRIWSVWFGAGVGLLENTWSVKHSVYDGSGVKDIAKSYDKSETTIKPMILTGLGIEARLTSVIAFTVDVGFQTNGETKFEYLKKNYSGVTGNLGLKFYIFN